MSDYSAPYQAVIAYLDSKDFKYTEHPEEHRITFRMTGKNSLQQFTVRITHGGEYLQVSVNYPFLVSNEKFRPSVAELITQANYGMPLGKFELDLKDGEVRFHITHVFGDTSLTSEIIERQFMSAYFTADRYFPAFMQLLHAGYTPEDAIFHAELDLHADQVTDDPKPPKTASKTPTSSSKLPPSDSVAQTRTSNSQLPAPSGTPQPSPAAIRKMKPRKSRPQKKVRGQDELPL